MGFLGGLFKAGVGLIPGVGGALSAGLDFLGSKQNAKEANKMREADIARLQKEWQQRLDTIKGTRDEAMARRRDWFDNSFSPFIEGIAKSKGIELPSLAPPGGSGYSGPGVVQSTIDPGLPGQSAISPQVSPSLAQGLSGVISGGIRGAMAGQEADQSQQQTALLEEIMKKLSGGSVSTGGNP